jgi:hypothetical protein
VSPPGDEHDEMTDGLGARRTAGGQPAAGDDDITHFLTELRALGDGPAPEPSRELAALLAGAHPFFARRMLVQVALRTALVAALIIGLLVAAAANHSLPQPAQKVVSHVVNVLTPFHIDPRNRPPATTVPTQPHVPAPSHPVAPTSPSHPSSSEPDDGNGNGSKSGGGGSGGEGGSDDGAGAGGPTGSDGGGQRDGYGDSAGGGSDDGSENVTTAHRSPTPSPTPHEDGGSDGAGGDG